MDDLLFSAPSPEAARIRRPIACLGEACDLPRRYRKQWRHQECPWRSGNEDKAICFLATPSGQYNYDQLAGALGTPFERKVPEDPTLAASSTVTYTAEEVGALFGIGKQRALALEKRAIQKIRKAILGRTGLEPTLRSVAAWIDDRLPEELEEVA